MFAFEKNIPLIFIGFSAVLLVVMATKPHTQSPIIIIKPTSKPEPTSAPLGSCPVPSEEMLRCMRQWACQYIIRLDLRCLLNLNGNPLLGGILGGGTTPAVTGASNGGILGGILGGR